MTEQITLLCQLILILSTINIVLSSANDCSIGHYLCQGPNKKCIALTAICDGKQDCPKGEDELSSYCKEVALNRDYQKYNPGQNYANVDRYVKQEQESVRKLAKQGQNENGQDNGENRYWPNNGCGAGQYLCNGTLNICVKFNDICNGVQDCPENDDENPEACANRALPKPRANTNGLLGTILSDKSGKNYRNYAGTGFMFHVDNLIIYNSDVKMFNQNSDNSGNLSIK